jgi:exodeoxyribonuclease VII large subunit
MKDYIVERLKQKRRELAQKEGKALYKIFSNTVLKNLALNLPKTKNDLSKIQGLEKDKIEKYGQEILNTINQAIFVLENKTIEKIFSVQEFLEYINYIFTAIGLVKIQGEITEVNHHSNGYCFFTIKDSQTKEHSINCYINKWTNYYLKHLLEVGMNVIVSAQPSLYKNSRFSIIVKNIEPYGEGTLKKAFEALKQELEAQGYFDKNRKKSIPAIIQKIGLITSESGAAIKDFMSNLGQYGFEIYFLDVRVEGNYAEESIIRAIRWFNKSSFNLDVLVLIRGGGSLEELKVFNSKKIAEAIILSKLPILTGIGHERDQTIADYCADYSFSTPSLVAAFIKNQREELIINIENYQNQLITNINTLINVQKENLKNITYNLISHFSIIIEKYKIIFYRLNKELYNSLNRIFKEFNILKQKFLMLIYKYEKFISNQLYALDKITQNCFHILRKKLDIYQHQLDTIEQTLIALNPKSILKRGYSIVYKKNDSIIKTIQQIKEGEEIFIKLYRGKIVSQVKQLKK